MSAGVFLLVIGAAVLHAVWNALVKGGSDKVVSMMAVVLGQAVIGGLALFFVAAPAPEAWPYIAFSAMVQVGYQIFLIAAYRAGDLTHVYPIARGSAPLLVALISVGFLGVTLAPIEMLAILTIGCGIISLSVVRRGDGQRNPSAAIFAVITGCFIATYSLIDGWGVRVAGTAVGYFGHVAVLNGIVSMAIVALLRPRALAELPRAWDRVVIGGGAAFAAYAMVVYAFLFAPIALVTALRETSIVFAMLIGVFFLRERLDLAKVISTLVTISGAAMMRLGKG